MMASRNYAVKCWRAAFVPETAKATDQPDLTVFVTYPMLYDTLTWATDADHAGFRTIMIEEV